ncbi:hypothetical protein ABH931_003486 [Streptacidiphilus sp. MAP12-33]|uniref:WhiB family transcriptional regulator n=1 Tax=Streptacidiphilus sp. MAP12-33 TaxID=3156266 RepID=UPI0035145219
MNASHVFSFVPPTTEGVLPCTRDPDLFFAPDGTESTAERALRVEGARRLCGECPHERRRLCRAWAHLRREWGIWGGRTEQENGYAPAAHTLMGRGRS